MTSRIEHLMTIADLEAFPDDDGNRYKLIEGELFVSCSLGLTHQIISDNLVHLIRNYLDKTPVGTVVSTIGLILSEYSGVIPGYRVFKERKYRENCYWRTVNKRTGDNDRDPLSGFRKHQARSCRQVSAL